MKRRQKKWEAKNWKRKISAAAAVAKTLSFFVKLQNHKNSFVSLTSNNALRFIILFKLGKIIIPLSLSRTFAESNFSWNNSTFYCLFNCPNILFLNCSFWWPFDTKNETASRPKLNSHIFNEDIFFLRDDSPFKPNRKFFSWAASNFPEKISTFLLFNY